MKHKDDPRLVEALNRMLAKEHACAIRYATHAAMVTGPHVGPVSARFREIAADEIAHAGKLRERICALGGTPTMEVDGEDLRSALTLDAMIEVNVLEERGAIGEYAAILDGIPRLDVLLRTTLEEILKDEQEHLEELIALVPMTPESGSGGKTRVRLDAGAPGAGPIASSDSTDSGRPTHEDRQPVPPHRVGR